MQYKHGLNFTFLLLILFSIQQSKAQDISWTEDVACIIYTNCSSCHNTSANVHIPNFPPKDVYASEATTDEMMLVYLP